MKKSLEFKILAIVGAMLIVGVISSGIIAVWIQKATLNSVTEFGTEKTASIIFQDIETTMIEGKADITKKLLANIRKIKGIEEVTVLDSEGRDAFKPGSPAQDAAALGELKSGREHLLQREKTRLTVYLPFKNIASCHACHGTEKPILGAVKLSVAIEKEYKKAMGLVTMLIVITFFGSLGFSFVLWIMLRKTIVKPIQSIEAAAAGIADGDLSFHVEGTSDDEIGRVSAMFKESFLSLERVLQRIKELSERISTVVEEVGRESEKVIKGAEAEAEATSNISSSVEELNATAAEIADNTDDLATSASDSSASIEQMVSSIQSVNSTIQELNSIVGSTSASIEQLSAATKEVALNAEELAGASEETLSAISEITVTIEEVNTHAKESARLSEKVMSDAATLGMASVAKTIEGMKEIQSSTRNTAECINLLGQRSKEIEMILNVIREVTDETTLLSLNAAILAAQAGEHGKGFSVVADEVKALARRTESSTKDIAALIQAVQLEVSNAASAMQKGTGSVELGLRLAQETEEALRRVLDSSKRSSEMTLSIERSTEEQARAANLVTQATERIRDMIDHIAKATSEQSQGVAVVMKAAERMKDLSSEVSKATGEQAISSRQIVSATEVVSERSRQISSSLAEHKKGSRSILDTIEGVKDIPIENRNLAFRIGKALWNLHKDAELLKAEMEHFRFSDRKGDSLIFGVVPLQEPSVMFRKFTPLSEYLGRRLGRKVDLKVAIDMEGAVNDLGQNVTQLCAMGPANYVEASTKFGVSVIAKALRKGKSFHRAAIVVRADSGIQSIADLKGRTVAFVSPKSATGHIAPLATLKDGGVTVNDIGTHKFLGSHEEVARAVLNGNFDAGGLMEETATSYREKGLRILQFSPEVPEFNLCCNSSVDEKTRNAVRDALISLDVSKAQDAEILQSLGKDCTGFVTASESDYNVFKEKILAIEAEINADSHLQGMRSFRS
jgi:phosphate/phosphite/phosphonate ABC transporter binding protein